MKTKYIDKNGQTIHYGDILKITIMESREKSKHSPRTPFAMIVKCDEAKDMIYISGQDDFYEISDLQLDEHKERNIIFCVEVFAERAVYEANLNRFNN